MFGGKIFLKGELRNETLIFINRISYCQIGRIEERDGEMILQGDCLDILPTLEDNSVDSIVTDPPYELGFMGKKWDSSGIAYNVAMWKECLRVLKPGGHLLAFGGTRTYHRMAVAIEDAGFEVRDMIEWVYGSGFPKSLNIGKVMDKFLKTGNASWNGLGDSSNGALGYSKLQHKQDYRPEDYSNRHQNKSEITEERAKEWEGWGTALKPAHEPICMARKPFKGTVAENVLKYGTGGINIDESKVGFETHVVHGKEPGHFQPGSGQTKKDYQDVKGRWPANLIHDNSEEVRECFPETKSVVRISEDKDEQQNTWSLGRTGITPRGHNDSGNASRFFKSIIYQAKASKSERNAGCEGLGEKPLAFSNQAKAELKRGNTDFDGGDAKGHGNKIRHLQNNHPTVKPIALMEYLINMVTPKGGTVLDPFMGSGTTGCACDGFNFIGIEMNDDYIKIAEARMEHWIKKEKQEKLF